MILTNILDKLQSAVDQKNKSLIFEMIDEFNNFCQIAFAPEETKLELSGENQAIATILKMPQVNKELSQIQAILKADRQDPYLSQLSLALQLLLTKIGWNPSDNKANAVSYMAREVRYNLKPYSKPMDLSFLSNPDPSTVAAHPQTMFGKQPKVGSFLFPEKYIWMMSPCFWQTDRKQFHYFTTDEKKWLKIKRHEDGLLYRPMEANRSIPDEFYYYVVSPKGGLYTLSNAYDPHLKKVGIKLTGRVCHASFRAGHPVLCAGNMKIKHGEIIEIDASSGHYSVPNENLLMSCLHLYHKDILRDTCKITNHHDKEETTVRDLLDNPKYESLREEYQQLLILKELPEEQISAVFS